MSGAGTTMSMIKTLKNNAQLLNRNKMFAQLKYINSKTYRKDTYTKKSAEDLALLRSDENKQLKRDVIKRRLVLVFVLIPMAIIVGIGIYLLIKALM